MKKIFSRTCCLLATLLMLSTAFFTLFQDRAENTNTAVLPSSRSNSRILATTVLQPGPEGFDAYYIDTSPDWKNPNATEMDCQGYHFFGSDIIRSFLKFDLSSLPPGIILSSAILNLTSYPGSGSCELSVHQLNVSWDEWYVCWNNREYGTPWTAPGGFDSADTNLIASAKRNIIGGSGSYDFDVTALADGWLKGSYPNDGVMLKITDDQICTSKSAYFYTGDETSNVSARPKLTLTYIQASVAIVSPDGGELWKGGSTQNIAWDITGGTGPFTYWLNYSTNSGATYPNTIAGPLAQGGTGAGNYGWSVPAITSSTVRVKIDIVDAGFIRATDFSAADFTIDSTIPLVSTTVPADTATGVSTKSFIAVTFSEKMDQASAQGNFSISPDPAGWGWTWNPAGDTMTGSHNPFQGLTAYTCTINTAAKDLAGNNLAPQKQWGFTTAAAPVIFVKSPSGGETWDASTVHPVGWAVANGTMPYTLFLNYTTDGGSTWNSILQGIPQNFQGGNSTSWTLPSVSSANCKVNIVAVDSLMQVSSSTSNATFTILLPASIAIDRPNGGELMRGGMNQTVKWTVSNGIAPYKIWANYSTNSTVGPWNTIGTIQGATQAGAGAGSGTWSVPAADYPKCRLSLDLIDNRSTKAHAMSAADFAIDTTPPFVVSTDPPGNSTNVSCFTSVNVTFNEPMNHSATESALLITPTISGTFSWNGTTMSFKPAAALAPSTRYTVDITAAAKNDAEINLPSQYEFWFLTAGPLKAVVRAPNGGETLVGDSYFNITWDGFGGNGTKTLILRYSIAGKSGAQFLIKDKMPNTGWYMWKVPNAPSNDCYLNITMTDCSNPPQGVFDDSDSNFTIIAAPLIVNVASPNGYENWTAGQINYIKWNTSGGYGTMHVDLDYSIDGSVTYYQIAKNITGAVSFQWTVPDPGRTKHTCFVRATVSDNSNPPNVKSDTSDHNFTIFVPPPPSLILSLQSPSGVDNWTAGTQQTITWTLTGGRSPYSFVTLDYSMDGVNGTYIRITAQGSGGSYFWLTPVLASTETDCFVRATITDNDSNVATATNSMPFTLYVPHPPTILVTEPNGGETWGANTTHFVSWVADGEAEPLKVNLSYSTQGINGPYTSIATGINGTLGSYAWTVPYTLSANCFVKALVTDSYGSGRTDEAKSGSTFTIFQMPADIGMTLISPVGLEKWSVGYNYEIKWSRTGGKGPFTTRIDYSTDGMASYTALATNALDNGSASSYVWTIPNKPSINCYLKINVTGTFGQTAERISGRFEMTTTPPPGVGSIVGYITFETDQPAPNVTVSVIDNPSLKVFTDSTGSFRINNVPEGLHSIKVSHPDYPEVVKSNIMVHKGQPANVGTIKLMKEVPLPMPMWMVILMAVIVLAAVAIFLGMLFSHSRRKRRDEEDEKQAPVWIHPAMRPQYQSHLSGSPSHARLGSQQRPALPDARYRAGARPERPVNKDAEIARLKALRDRGLITEDEYEYSRGRIMGEAPVLKKQQTQKPAPKPTPTPKTKTVAEETEDEDALVEETTVVEDAEPELRDDEPSIEETAAPLDVEEKSEDELRAEESGDLVALALAKADKVTGGKKDEKAPPPPKPKQPQKKTVDFRTLHRLVRDDDMKDDDEWVSKDESDDGQTDKKEKIV